MKKRNSKKGFTLVELVIVIAVIAILASVLIPTFGGIIDKANQSAALQEAKNAYTEAYALDLSDGKLDYDKTVYTATSPAAITSWTSTEFVYTTTKGHTVKFNGSTWTVTLARAN